MTDTPNDPPPPPGGPPPPPPGDTPPPPPPSGGEPLTGPTGTPPGGGPEPPDESNRKLMLVLSYLGPLSLVPLLMEQDDREIQWHAKNGLGLFIAALLVGILLSLVGNVILDSGCLSCGVGTIYWLAVLGLSIFGIAKALSGEKLRLPLISDFADK